MTRYTDNLWGDLVREHGRTLMQADRYAPGRPPLLRRPRVLAGSTLALAAAGTALALGLTATGSTPAFAVTTTSNGSVLVNLNINSSLPQVNAKLTAMGIHEQVSIQMASGPAAASGPVSCKAEPGAPGPTVKILDGKDGTEVIKPGTTGDNTGVGTWHLAACWTFKTGDTGTDTGNSGMVVVPVSPSGG
jgi:hypothetical protein